MILPRERIPCAAGLRSADGSPVWAYIYPHGLKYEGDFVNGRYNGQGTLSQPDGSKYVGTFENDMANGNGIEFGADGAVLRSVNSGTQLRTFFQFPTARPNYLSNLLSVSH